jgi:hypothetical protein
MTTPSAIDSWCGLLTFPSTSSTSKISSAASASVRSTTSGTSGRLSPAETTRSTGLPAGTSFPAPGSLEMTRPSGISGSFCRGVAPTRSPASTSRSAASESVTPTTSGTVTGSGPVDTYRSTGLPFSSGVPARGSWSDTEPDGMSGWSTFRISPVVKPSAASSRSARSRVIPITSGTGGARVSMPTPDSTTATPGKPSAPSTRTPECCPDAVGANVTATAHDAPGATSRLVQSASTNRNAPAAGVVAPGVSRRGRSARLVTVTFSDGLAPPMN